jgi:hypothetical protein
MGFPVRTAGFRAREVHEQRFVICPTQMRSTWYALLQNIELMPQYQDLGFQPLST